MVLLCQLLYHTSDFQSLSSICYVIDFQCHISFIATKVQCANQEFSCNEPNYMLWFPWDIPRPGGYSKHVLKFCVPQEYEELIYLFIIFFIFLDL